MAFRVTRETWTTDVGRIWRETSKGWFLPSSRVSSTIGSESLNGARRARKALPRSFALRFGCEGLAVFGTGGRLRELGSRRSK